MVTLGGISLSPAFVIMFVMQHYQLSWEDALHLVQNRRYCISPNGGFLTQIKVCVMNDSIFVGRMFL
jgi:serine/threonine/tyrosine-interacting protein